MHSDPDRPGGFLSTPSARRATFRSLSIKPWTMYFYPRPPRGGRHERHCRMGDFNIFLSTPSARRATEAGPQAGALGGISIHALREEGDAASDTAEVEILEFLSTPSARRATLAELQNIMMRAISIHALREEGDKSLLATASFCCSFLSTPSARRATY